MKHFKQLAIVSAGLSLVAFAGCSSLPGQNNKNSEEIAIAGPTVLDAKTNPGTFELNQNLDPVSRTQVVASVKDFSNKVTDVRIRFLHVPMEIQMKSVSGSTWIADLSGNQLKQLAVNGHTMKYEANVIARDSSGKTAVSKSPIEISVRAPDINATG